MGRRGPIGKTAEAKQLAGNPGKRKAGPAPPAPVSCAPSCPDWLDEEARAEWGRVIPLLELKGLAEKVDRAGVAMYCMTWSRWCAAERVIAEHGLTITPTHVDKEGHAHEGLSRKRPEVAIAESERKLLRQFLCEFGLTPSSRQRVKGTPQATKDGMDALLES